LQVWSTFPSERLAFLKAELSYFDEVTDVSGRLYSVEKDCRKSAVVEMVGQVSSAFQQIQKPKPKHLKKSHLVVT